MSSKIAAAAVAAVLGVGAIPADAGNILQDHWSVISTTGIMGTLEPGSIWLPGGPLGAQASIVDGIFLPEQTSWIQGTWWWSEAPAVNPNPVVTVIGLREIQVITGLRAQTDNNDWYRIEYLDGSDWKVAWDVPGVPGFGMTTRDSGPLQAFATDRLRITAVDGDGYYAISELQAFGPAAVPEPGSLALIAGAGLVLGAVVRRRRT